MESGADLAKRLREVLLDGKWIANTNYREQLSEIDWKTATQKINGLNSIAALTFHINYYLDGVLELFRGGELTIRDKYSFDMPPVESQEDWEALRDALLTNAEAFAQELEKLTSEDLEAPFVMPQYGPYRRNLEGVIEHCYYHLGQISLLHKLLKQDKAHE